MKALLVLSRGAQRPVDRRPISGVHVQIMEGFTRVLHSIESPRLRNPQARRSTIRDGRDLGRCWPGRIYPCP